MENISAKTIIINVGVSGAGKSTWTLDFMFKNDKFVRMNRDTVRASLFGTLIGYYKHPKLKEREEIVTKVMENIANVAVLRGLGLIIDNTNLDKYFIEKIIKFADAVGYKIKFKIFDETDPAILKSRVRSRDKIEELSYIDKQINDFKSIKTYLQQYKNQFL